MVLLIIAGYFKWIPGHLSNGLLICAAVIGIFPIFKNALFDTIASRRPNLELLLGIALIAGLAMGWYLETSVIALCILLGSFLHLNFSWKRD